MHVLKVPGEFLQHAIFAATMHGVMCVGADERMPTILCDNLVRAKHAFAQQSKVLAPHERGRTRDLHCLLVDHFPEHWTRRVPCTWEAYARHVDSDLTPETGAVDATGATDAGCAAVDALPHPLREHAILQGLLCEEERFEEAHARAALLRAERSRR